MDWELIQAKPGHPWLRSPLTWIITALLFAAALLAMPVARKAYHLASERRHVQRATNALARRDFSEAILDARGALALQPENTEALRCIAAALEGLGAPEALSFRVRLETLLPQDRENLVALATDALQNGDTAAAERGLAAVLPADRGNVQYQILAARCAAARKDAGAEEAAWAAALKLDPQQEDARFQLDRLRVNARDPALHEAAVADLERLRNRPSLRGPALLILLNDALQRGAAERAKGFADLLADAPEASFADSLVRLSALRELQDPTFDLCLAALQREAASKPQDVYRLMVWMVDHDLALLVPDWAAQLPGGLTSSPPISVGLAAALARASAWSRLRDAVQNATWGDYDFLRLAYHSRAAEKLADPAASNLLWVKALNAAQARAEWLEPLGRTALEWGWRQRAEEALWKRASAPRCPHWALELLWSEAWKRRDTPRLFEVARMLLAADPKSTAARNNFAMLALLTGRDTDAPPAFLDALYRDAGGNPLVAATYALGQCRRGRPSDAVATLRRCTDAELREPTVALYLGVFLTLSGHPDEAMEYFQRSAAADYLPEERAMSDYLDRGLMARALERAGEKESATREWNRTLALANSRPAALETLGRLATEWQMPRLAVAALWKYVAAGGSGRWAVDYLWEEALRSGSAADRAAASRLLAKTDPLDPVARHFALTEALLAGTGDQSARSEAEALYRENNCDPERAATYALSLFVQDKASLAAAVLGKLDATQLHQGRPAFYYGTFLLATGRPEKATEFLRATETARRLPEEEALLARVRANTVVLTNSIH